MGSPTIVVVEDNHFFQDATCRLLAFDYPDVIATDRPATALKWVQNANPELVVTDVCFPQGNGFQLLREIREVSAVTKVLLLTGYRDLLYLREVFASA